jgi:PAS domain S-box-containing protein
MTSQKNVLKIKHIYAGALIALAILLTVVVLGYVSLDKAKESTEWVSHTLKVISNIHKIEGKIGNLGSSQRDYIVTTQLRYLNEYESVVPELQDELLILKALTVDNEFQEKKLIELESLIGKLKSVYAVNIDHVQKGRVQQAIKRVREGVNSQTLGRVKNIIDEMIHHEEKLLNQRLEIQKKVSNQSTSFILTGCIFTFLLVFLATALIVREFKRKLKIQESLNKTSEIQRAILNSAAFALIACDKDGTVTHFNPAAEKLLGFSSKEVIGKSPGMFHLQSEMESMAQKLSERFKTPISPDFSVFRYRADLEIIETDHWTFIRKDGSKVPISLSVTSQRNEQNVVTGYLGIAYDITTQLEYEKEIIEAKEQALAGTKAKSEFLANMSHEIRTPMNAIMGMAELLNETQLDDEQRKYVDVFQRAGESLLNIINDILDLSKIEAGHFELDINPFTLSNVIDQAAEIMALRAHQKGIELAIDVDEGLNDFYIGDNNRLRQILLNIIGNAVKFTKKGEILLHVTSGKENPDFHEIKIEIQDTGIGMNEGQLKRLFERFNQADSSITKEYGGTGLGLNITKRLVELMNGSIHVESVVDVGTKFTITVQLKDDKAPHLQDENITLRGKKVLIVDDTKTNRFILRKILDYQGAITSETNDGEEAIKYIREEANKNEPFDLVLLDCRMPGLDGFSVADKIQNSELKGPLIMMLTSDNRAGDLARARALGLKSYLVKPVLKNQLLTEIGRAMSLEEPPKKATSIPEQFDGEPLKILLVDDNDENRLVIRSFLRKYPWTIEEAKNGREALEFFSPQKYDVVLMDMQMPILDGYSATREIRKIEHETKSEPTPVLALTAYALTEEVDKSFEAGCNGHLSKPISKASLIEAIKANSGTLEIVIDPDLEDLIPDYVANRRKEVLDLIAALERKDFNHIQAVGHKLRGSAGSYGFEALSEVGKVLEERGHVSDAVSVKRALNEYQQYLKRMKISYA